MIRGVDTDSTAHMGIKKVTWEVLGMTRHGDLSDGHKAVGFSTAWVIETKYFTSYYSVGGDRKVGGAGTERRFATRLRDRGSTICSLLIR